MSTVVGGTPANLHRLDALAWWRLWSLAALIHVLGNGLSLGFGLRSIPNLLLGLRHYLAANPDIAVTFTIDGELFDLERAGDHPEWTVPLPWYLERFAPFRAVPIEDPPPCQPSFLPAR